MKKGGVEWKNGAKNQTQNVQDRRNNMEECTEALGDAEDKAYLGDIT